MDKWVDLAKKLMQPLVTVIAVVIILRLLNVGFDPDLMFKLAAGILIFWFGYTGLKSFNFNKDDSKKASNQSTAPAGTGEQMQGIILPEGDSWHPVEPKYDYNKGKFVEPSEPEPDEPLNVNEFIDAIENTESIMKNSGVINDSTRFYNAERVFNNWDFHDEVQVTTAETIVLKYSKLSMAPIWWKDPTDEQKADPVTYAINHLNEDSGCTTCTRTCTYPTLRFKAIQNGPGYYTSLNDVLRWEEVNGIERDPSLIGH
jgi:hypothetical protein